MPSRKTSARRSRRKRSPAIKVCLKLRDELQTYTKHDENTTLQLNRFMYQFFFLRVLGELGQIPEHTLTSYGEFLLSQIENPTGALPKNLGDLRIFKSYQNVRSVILGIPRTITGDTIEKISESDLGEHDKVGALDSRAYLLGELFETLKAHFERKRRGSFYTPPWLASQICKQILSFAMQDMSHDKSDILSWRILDNACGGGVFLIAMLENLAQLIESSDQAANGDVVGQLAQKLVENCLFGQDIDPEALAITEAQLWIALQTLNPSNQPLNLVRSNLTAGDTLLQSEQHRDFDIILGNPPYLKLTRLGTRYREGLSSKYRPNREYNVHALFIESAISELREGGFLGYLLHKNFFTLDTYSNLRKRIVNSCEILSMIDCGPGIFPRVTAETAILILQKKRSHPGSMINLMRSDSASMEFVSRLELPLAKYASVISNWNSRFILGLSRTDAEPLLVLANYPKLADFVSISRGIETGSNTKFISREIQGDMHLPVTRGSDISKFSVDRRQFIDYRPNQLAKPGRVDLLRLPKVVLQQNAMSPIACYDSGEYLVLNSVTYLADAAPKMLKALCVILNSQLVDWFFQLVMTNGSRVTVNILPNNLGLIPIPKNIDIDVFSRLHDSLVATKRRSGIMREAFEAFEIIHQKIAEAMVQEAYFPTPGTTFDIAKDIIEILEGPQNLHSSIQLSRNTEIIERADKRLTHRYRVT